MKPVRWATSSVSKSSSTTGAWRHRDGCGSALPVIVRPRPSRKRRSNVLRDRLTASATSSAVTVSDQVIANEPQGRRRRRHRRRPRRCSTHAPRRRWPNANRLESGGSPFMRRSRRSAAIRPRSNRLPSTLESVGWNRSHSGPYAPPPMTETSSGIVWPARSTRPAPTASGCPGRGTTRRAASRGPATSRARRIAVWTPYPETADPARRHDCGTRARGGPRTAAWPR